MQSLFDRFAGRQHLSHQEIIITSGSALIAIAMVAWISSWFLSHSSAPYLVASMGASAVLLFAVPSSPMNRIWSVLVSHLSAAAIGITCALFIPNLLIAAPLAVAGALLAMHHLRCLHPPGGATALLIVLAGAEVRELGYLFVLTPVFLNTVVLLLSVWAVKFLQQILPNKESYVSPTSWHSTPGQSLDIKPPFEVEDLATALGELDTYIDVNQDELMRLYTLANRRSHQRRLGELRCADLMISNPVAAEFSTTLEETWRWLGQFHITAIPVVNRAQHVIGIVTLDDFVAHAKVFPYEQLDERIQALIKTTHELTSDKPEVVGQIMTQPVITAPESSLVAELIPLLDNKKIHHIPIVNDKAKLVGVLSRKQIMSLFQRT